MAGDSAPADLEISHTSDLSLAPQGYQLNINPSSIALISADAAGERYGRAALAQIKSQCGPSLPTLEIRDWPDFAVRGYMLDISRDRVPTRATLQRLVEVLDLLRINHFELYTEHTFAYQRHTQVWRNASPLDGEDIRWLDELCQQRGIELAANQNGFGHMERWLKHEPYQHLAEAPGGWTTSWGARWPAAVLHPDAASLDLVLGLYDELLPHFSSRRVNIGCDETFELGKGRSRERVSNVGRGRVYLDFLKKILDAMHRSDKEVLFWGDVIRQHPELVSELPRDQTIPLVWHYEAPIENPTLPKGLETILEEVGMSEEILRGFAGQAGAFAGSGLPYWVCPGTSSWNSLLGRMGNAKANLVDAAKVGLDSGASGYLITDWGDNGHMQPPSVSFAPLTYGACVSWSVDANRDINLAEVLDRFVFEDPTRSLAKAFLCAGQVYKRSGARGFNGSPLFYSLLDGPGIFSGGDAPTQRGIDQVAEDLASAERGIAAATPTCADAVIVCRELQQAIRLTRMGARELAKANDLSAPDPVDENDAAAVIEEQRSCWLQRSRPGGLADSIAKLKFAQSG